MIRGVVPVPDLSSFYNSFPMTSPQQVQAMGYPMGYAPAAMDPSSPYARAAVPTSLDAYNPQRPVKYIAPISRVSLATPRSNQLPNTGQAQLPPSPNPATPGTLINTEHDGIPTTGNSNTALINTQHDGIPSAANQPNTPINGDVIDSRTNPAVLAARQQYGGNIDPANPSVRPEDVEYYKDQVSSALNSLYNTFSTRRCDQCDGNCLNYRCYGCGGCMAPPAEKQTYFYPYQREDAGTFVCLFNNSEFV